ncbi:MAG: carboxypeptidase-like regulatory domain-containing protein [Lachnospiraceae bacterium]
MMVTNKMKKWKKGLVILLAATLVLQGNMADAGRSVTTFAETEETYQVQTKSVDGTEVVVEHLTEVIKVRDFSVSNVGGDSAIINVNDTFAIDLQMPTDTKVYTQGYIRFFLVPYGSENAAKDFADGLRYGIDYEQCTRVYGLALESATTSSASFSSVLLNSTGLYDPPLLVIPSGAYYPAVVVYEEDVMSEAAHSKASLVLGTKPVRVSNPEDGGYLGDEHYGVEEEKQEYVELNVTVYLEGEIYDKCRVVAYSEDLLTCYGNVPCKVIPGETVAISVVPEYPEMGYTYNFGNIKNGSPYYVQVPEDGYVDVTVYPFTKGAEAYGRVCDENNQPLSNVTVSLEMKTAGTISESVTTDKDGNYRFTGIYNGGDAVLHFSKDGYYLEDYIIPQSQLSEGSSISCNMTLKESEPVFSLTLSEDIDPSFAKVLWKEVREYLHVYDHTGNKEIPGTFVNGEDGLSFLPEWESDLGDSYVVNLKYPHLEMVSVTVNKNQSAELRVNAGAVAFQALLGDNHYGYVTVEVMDGAGEHIYTKCELPKVTDEVLLQEGSYQLLFYATASQTGLSDEQYSSIMDAEHMVTFSVENGTVTELGEIEVPFVNATGENPFAEKSFLTVPLEIKPSEDLLTISGHIEADSSDYKISSFRIYAINNVSGRTEQSVTAMYENGTLAVNGELVSTSLYQDTKNTYYVERIDLETPVNGACDFSAKLRINEHTSMIVTVMVDAVVNGMTVRDISLGEYYVSGDKVTLNAFDTTATGEVYCYGFATPNSTVYLYDGSNLLSSVDVNQWGKWETVVWFPRENDAFAVVRTYSSTHVLKAVCDGEESAPLTVYFKSDCAALSGIYLVEEGKRYTDSYVWKNSTKMSCEADVQNADRISEDPVFRVLCSDGTMLEFPAKKGETKSRLGIPITTYYSETFDYGEKNLLPVKVWFDFKQESVKQKLPEPLPGEFTSALIPNASSKMNVTYKEIPKIPSVSEFGDDVIVTLTTYETTEAELDAMKNAGADFYQVHDGKQIVYGEYIQTLETGVKYGIVDFTENTYKVVEMHIYDKDNCPVSTETSSKENESELILMSVPNGQTGQQEGGGLTNATLWTVVVEDFKKEVSGFGDEGVEYLAGYMKNSSNSMISKASPYINKVGVGQVMNGFELGGSANAAYEREQTASGNKDIISFLIRSSYDLPREQGQRIENMAHQARDDYNRATNSTNKNLGTEIMCGIANEAISKHPLGKEVVDATEFTGIQGAIKSASSSYADADWAYAEQSFTELMFEYMKATNLSRDEIADLYSKYQDGKMSMKEINDYVRNSLRRDKKNDGNSKNYTGIVDPSGYIYEAVASNRVEGATVTLYGEGMEWFEAEAFGQSNPLISDSDGRYAWDVPEGNWFVKVYKAGYEENTSQNDPAATVTIDGINYLPVLPPQLDVNIGLTSVEKPHASMQFADGSWYLMFDRYVETATVTAENINIECAKLNGKTDASYSFEAADAEISPEHTPICGGKLLAKSFKIILQGIELAEEDAMTVTLNAAVTGYNGKSANGLVKVNGGFTAGQEEVRPSEPETPGRTEDKNKEDEMPVGIILAIVAGIVVVLAGSVAGVLILRRRKKKNK